MYSLQLTLSSVLLALLGITVKAHRPLVNIPGGPIISGYSESGTEHFLGVPFGQDTSGSNRFAPPKPVIVIPGAKIDGTVPGPACPQSVDPHSILPDLNSNFTHQSEDCLNLRIARPSATTNHAGLPVMVFLYGGGFTNGQIYDKFYNPEGLVVQSVENESPVIYVAVNYRLSSMYFCT
jgi:carboxylesterase type B